MNSCMIEQIRGYISKSLDETDEKNIFGTFIEKCRWYYEKPAHSINEIKMKQNTKIKGDVFEHFAYLYFTHVKGWNVWFLKDIPQETKKSFALKNQDLGIDLVAYNPKNKKYYAIQVKYRKFNQRSKTVLGWKQLSTFLVLASRTGPWEKYIVFTNAHYIRHAGRKSQKDWSMCLGTMKGIKRHQWESMIGYKSNNLLGNLIGVSNILPTEPLLMNIDEIRRKRLAMFSN